MFIAICICMFGGIAHNYKTIFNTSVSRDAIFTSKCTRNCLEAQFHLDLLRKLTALTQTLQLDVRGREGEG